MYQPDTDEPTDLEDLLGAERALVVGIGGGGDVVGAVPTARFLERHGVETLLGGIPWERPILDPTPGPYPLDRLEIISNPSASRSGLPPATPGRTTASNSPSLAWQHTTVNRLPCSTSLADR